jgi:hypothetical protein
LSFQENSFVSAFCELRHDVKSDKDLLAKGNAILQIACVKFFTFQFVPGLEICEQFSIQPQQFRDKWEAYIDQNGADGPPKIDHFEAIRLEIARKFKKGQEKDIHANMQRGSRQAVF